RGHHPRVPRRNQGRPGGPRLCVFVQRGPGLQPRRRSHRPDPPARGRQLHLRRAGRRGPVHYHGHGDLGRCPQPPRGRPPAARPGIMEVTAMIAVGTRRALDAKGTDAVMTAAETEAIRNGYRVVIAVVDAWGHVLQLRRTEGAQPASDQVAIDKARTAAIFIRPSREIEEQVSAGRLGALALHGAVALTGDGEVVGAIGTSGETPDQDESVSLAGAHTSFSTTDVPALTREGAQVAADAAAAVATGREVWPVVAVVDA